MALIKAFELKVKNLFKFSKSWHDSCFMYGNTARLIRQLSSIIPFLDQGYLIEVWPFFLPLKVDIFFFGNLFIGKG